MDKIASKKFLIKSIDSILQQQYVVHSNPDESKMVGPTKIGENVQQVKAAESVPANPYSSYGYAYTGPPHHYHKNAPKVTNIPNARAPKRFNFYPNDLFMGISQSNCERMVPNALPSGNQQQKCATNSTGNKSPDVQLVDVRWPAAERDYDGNGKHMTERIITHGRSFQQQQEKMQPVMVSFCAFSHSS